jgi:hypothetical protein
MIDLKSAAGDRYRVVTDESWVPGEDRRWHRRIPARYGHIYVHGAAELGVFCDASRVWRRLAAIPGARLHQSGDGERAYVIPFGHLDAAASIIRARRRPQLSDERRAALAARMATVRLKLPCSGSTSASATASTATAR